MSSISEKLLGNAVAEMANYLDTVVTSDKRKMVSAGFSRLINLVFAMGVICGLMAGSTVTLVILKFAGHLS